MVDLKRPDEEVGSELTAEEGQETTETARFVRELVDKRWEETDSHLF